MVPKDEPNYTPSQLADLTALADGSIDPERRGDVEAWVNSSPERREVLRHEQLALTRLLEARTADRAPDGLRRRIEQQREPGPQRSWRPSFAATTATVAGLAAAAVTLVIVLPSGTAGTPPVAQAAALASRGSTQAAPALDPQNPGARLEVAVQNVYFPNWAWRSGWRAVGQREDVLDGRAARTVYYASHGKLLAYTILGTPALPEPSASSTMVNGLALRTLQAHGRTIVTWRRDGHTCVISAIGVPASTLQGLAAYEPA